MSFIARFDGDDRRPFSVDDGLVTSGFGWSFEYAPSEHVSIASSAAVFVAVDGWVGSNDGRAAERVLARYRADEQRWHDNLSGEFAAVVIDSGRGLIEFLRDKVGVRPLYMNSVQSRRVVASTIKQVVDEPYVSKDIDEEEVTFRLARLSPDISATVYKFVRAIPPGSLLSLDGPHHRQKAALNWDFVDRTDIPLDEAVTISRTVVSQALKAAVPDPGTAGYELSGGLDSSSLVGLAASSHDNVLAGRILFEDRVADERRFSQAVIDHWELDSVDAPPLIPSPEQLGAWVEELAHPLPLANATMSGLLHRGFADAGRNIVVTGVGGDDAFADMGKGTRIVDALRTRDRASLSRFGAEIRSDPGSGWRRIVRPGILELLGRPTRRDPIPWVSDRAKELHGVVGLYRARPNQVSRRRSVDDRWGRFTEGYMVRIMEDLARLENLGWLRLTHPFIAAEVVEATYGLHPDLPAVEDDDRTVQREAFADVLPDLLKTRSSKAEFSAMGWQAVHASEALDDLADGPLAASGLVDVDYLKTRKNDATKNSGAVLPLLQLVSFDQWLRTLS